MYHSVEDFVHEMIICLYLSKGDGNTIILIAKKKIVHLELWICYFDLKTVRFTFEM